MRWDIFCCVVDNLGDIGVSWRLARQLAAEHAAKVRLWVDDLVAFRMLAPGLEPNAGVQMLGEVQVLAWTAPFVPVEPADVVVETFGCETPASYVEAMARRARPPVWVNLEYLSAEHWVEGCHGLPSPHPRLPLTRYFFFPGFSPRTGGVLIERGLMPRRLAFQQDAAEMAQFLGALGIRSDRQGELRVSLFCYEQAPLPALLEAWAAGSQAVTAIAFRGTPGERALEAFGVTGQRHRGALAGIILPFLTHADYDRLLWACDWNFVRGEDSFVRAQLAARPLVWQAYPQSGDAHATKLQAFLDCQATARGAVQPALAALWQAWNGLAPVPGLAPAWDACMAGRPALEAAAAQWPAHLESLGDLAGNLARFCAERV